MSSALEESKSCLSCGHQGDGSAAVCARCGRRMFSTSSIRNRGWVLIVVGLVLTIFMGVVIIYQAGVVYHSGEPNAQVRFTGGTGMAWLMFGIMGLVFFFGIASIVNGIWQVRFGKRKKSMAYILFGLYAVLGIVVALVLLFSPSSEPVERRTVQPRPFTPTATK